MTKKLIGVEIVHHRLAGMPRLIELAATDNEARPFATSLNPVRGIGTAMILSLGLWAMLIAAIY